MASNTGRGGSGGSGAKLALGHGSRRGSRHVSFDERPASGIENRTSRFEVHSQSSASGSCGELPSLEHMLQIMTRATIAAKQVSRAATKSIAAQEAETAAAATATAAAVNSKKLMGGKDEGTSDRQAFSVKVEVRAQGAAFLMLVRPVTPHSPILHRIANRTHQHTLLFRQIDCDEYDWQELHPGGEVGYAWEGEGVNE